MSFMAEMANPSSLTNQMYRFNQAQQEARYAEARHAAARHAAARRAAARAEEDEELDRAQRSTNEPHSPIYTAFMAATSSEQELFVLRTYRETGQVPTRSQVIAHEKEALLKCRQNREFPSLFDTIRMLFTSCFGA